MCCLQARALFYVLHVAAQNDMAQRHGLIFLYHATVRDVLRSEIPRIRILRVPTVSPTPALSSSPTQSVPLTPQLRKRAKRRLHIVQNCAPLRLRGCHGMYPPESRSLATLVRPAMLGIMSRNARQRTVQHVGSPREHAVQLESYGLTREGIPIEFGGTYVDD
jgi:hypothetical protein